MAVRIGIVADKGGVGRSAMVALLAERFAKMGFLTLCVDMDHQAIISRRLGYEMYGADRDLMSTASLMRQGVRSGQAKDAIVPCRWSPEWASRISVIPASEDLGDADTNPGPGNPTGRLDRSLEGVDDDIHVTMFDTRPDTFTCTQAVWTTCDYLFGVTSADRDSAEGILRTLVKALGLAEDLNNSELKIGGVILNEYDGTSREQQRGRALIESTLQSPTFVDYYKQNIPILDVSVPQRTYIRYAESKGLPLEVYLKGDTMQLEKKRREVETFMTPLAQTILEVTGVAKFS